MLDPTKPRHPHTTTVTLLIVAERQRLKYKDFDDQDRLEYSVQEVIKKFFDEWENERMADLYSLIAEKVKATMTMGQMEVTIEAALWANQNHWEGR